MITSYLSLVPIWVWIPLGAVTYLFVGNTVASWWEEVTTAKPDDKIAECMFCLFLWPLLFMFVYSYRMGKWLASPSKPKIFPEPEEIMKEKDCG